MSPLDFHDWYTALGVLLLNQLQISIPEVAASTDISLVELRGLYRDGQSPEEVFHRIQHELDPEAA